MYLAPEMRDPLVAQIGKCFERDLFPECSAILDAGRITSKNIRLGVRRGKTAQHGWMPTNAVLIVHLLVYVVKICSKYGRIS